LVRRVASWPKEKTTGGVVNSDHLSLSPGYGRAGSPNGSGKIIA
jgi:hypothetical protein